MESKFTFRSMEPSQALETLALKKLHSLDKFLLRYKPQFAEFIFEAHKHHKQFIFELRVQAGATHCVAKKEGDDMYALLDQVISAMSAELAKAKEKHLDAHHGK